MAEAPKSENQSAAAAKASELMETAKTTAEAVQVKVVGAAENAIDATKAKFQSSGEHAVAEGGAEKKKEEESGGGDGGLMDKAKSHFTK